MQFKQIKMIGASILAGLSLSTTAHALGGNGFDMKLYNHAQNGQNLYFWTMLKNGFKPARGVIVNGNDQGTNNIVIPVSLKKDVQLELNITDRAGNTIWDGWINFNSGEPTFSTQVYMADPNYTVVLNTDAEKRFVSIDIQ